MAMATGGPPKPLARCGVATRSSHLPQRLACGALAGRHLAGPARRLLAPGIPGTPGYSSVAAGAAAAISVALQPGGDGSASHVNNGSGAAKPGAAPGGNGASANGSGGSSKSVYNTVAAAVAAQFPAVPPLPPPPNTANLTDVVPYLLRLALQERNLVWRLAAALSCMCVAKLAGISLPLAFKGAVDAMASAGFSQAALSAALMAALTYGVLDCVRVVAKESQSPFFAPVSQAVTRRMAYHTFAHVLDLDTRFHLDRRTGRVSRILERGTRSIAVLYRAMVFTFLPTGLELAAVGVLLAGRFGPALAGILGLTFAAYVTWTVLMTQAATDVRKEVNALDNATSSKAVDALLNVETVTLFNNQHLEVGLYDRHLRDFQSASYRTELLSSGLNAGQGLILAAGMAAILAAIISSPGGATGGDLVMASGLITQLWAPLQFLGWFYRELRAALVDMEEFFQILRTRSNIVDGTRPLPPAPLTMAVAAAAATGATTATSGQQSQRDSSTSSSSSSSGSSSSSSSGSSTEQQQHEHHGGGLAVELVDVSFGYTAERQILKGVSLRVAPGESVAVVGSSGSGKSTILKLVTRLYDVWGTPGSPDIPRQASGAEASTSGSSSSGGSSSCGVYINGVDVRQLRLADLRSAIAVVPQDTALNYESIMENIRYGRPDATDEEVVAAARAARLHDTVASLPEGYNTVVGERGLKLSGGEKQRVAIARAFLRSPRLLICDEATSALDSATEAAIMESLKELAQGRSALFVAHRLSTVRGCDRIVVLRGGRVLEEGSHDQLMERGGEYAAMWNLQANQHDEEDGGVDGMAGGGGGSGSGGHGDDGGVTDTEAEIELALEAAEAHTAAAAAAAAEGNGSSSSKHSVPVSAAAAAVGAKGGPTGLSLDSMDEVATYSRRAAAAVVAAAASATAAAAALGGGVNAA